MLLALATVGLQLLGLSSELLGQNIDRAAGREVEAQWWHEPAQLFLRQGTAGGERRVIAAIVPNARPSEVVLGEVVEERRHVVDPPAGLSMVDVAAR